MTTNKDESKRTIGVIFQNSASTLKNLKKIILFYLFLLLFLVNTRLQNGS